MNRLTFFTCSLTIASIAWTGSAIRADWLGFRGDGTSTATGSAPDSLNVGDDGNRAWSIPMPGRSVASPIVVDNLAVTTSSSGPNDQDLYVTAVELKTGKTRWQRHFRATGRPFVHATSAGAAPSLVSDGERIVAFFSSNDLMCLSKDGSLLWTRGLGSDYRKAGNDLGMASSPVIAGNAVIVLAQNQGDSFAAAVDLTTGKNLWRIPRPASANWSSPLILKNGNSSTVVLQSTGDIIAVDAMTGETQWSLDDGGATVVSPTLAGDQLLLPGEDLLALKLSGRGETPVEMWRDNKLAPSNTCVAATGDRLYILKGSVLLAANSKDGELVWRQRLSGLGKTWATPVVANSLIYVFDQEGNGQIIRDLGEKAEVTNEVELGEGVLGTPAISQGCLIVRSKTALHCFSD